KLAKRVAREIAEIGHHLSLAKGMVGHGRWLQWLESEFGWTDQTARNFIHVHELVEARTPEFKKFLDLDLPVSTLYLIAAPGTPDAARNEIIDRATAGEPITREIAQEVIANTKGAASAVNAKPLPDIVDGCTAAVRRRIADTVVEIRNHQKDPEKKIGRLVSA